MSKDKEPTAENVFKMFDGGKPEPTTDTNSIPSNEYEITDIDGVTQIAEGFLIFTAQHLAVMRDDGNGAIPVLVMPLSRLHMAVMTEEVTD